MLQPQNLKKYDCVEKRGIFFLGVVFCRLGGESWDGEEKEEIWEEIIGRVVIY
jgi:hypothetical protein